MGLVTFAVFYTILILSSIILTGVHGSAFSHRKHLTNDHEKFDKVIPLRNSTTRSFDSALATSSDQPQKHCNAGVVIKSHDPNKRFLGSNCYMSVSKPVVTSTQWSSFRVKLSNEFESIEAGWMVNPSFFNDNEAHLYARFSAGGHDCLNLQCPGFVQEPNTKLPLGYIAEKYSEIGGNQYATYITIDKKPDDGSWRLSMTKDKVIIGYWPKNLFTSLAEVASQVEWGGEVDNPTQTSPSPDMGNGLKAVNDPKVSSTFNLVTVIDQDSHNVNPEGAVIYADCGDSYTVIDQGYKGDYWGHLISYGGPHT